MRETQISSLEFEFVNGHTDVFFVCERELHAEIRVYDVCIEFESNNLENPSITTSINDPSPQRL